MPRRRAPPQCGARLWYDMLSAEEQTATNSVPARGTPPLSVARGWPCTWRAAPARAAGGDRAGHGMANSPVWLRRARIWSILPVVICFFQGLSHASVRVHGVPVNLWMAHYISNRPDGAVMGLCTPTTRIPALTGWLIHGRMALPRRSTRWPGRPASGWRQGAHGCYRDWRPQGQRAWAIQAVCCNAEWSLWPLRCRANF